MLFQSPDDLGFDPNQVTPGWIGFTATALVAGVVILLLFDFFRRVSRIQHRAEAKERIEAELAERDAAAAASRPLGGSDALPRADRVQASDAADASAGSEREPAAGADAEAGTEPGESSRTQA